jgi:hypothetical protein
VAKYGSNSVTIEFDNSGGTLQNMTQYVTAINSVDIEAVLEESHSFGDSWFESLATGLRKMGDVTLSGFYDDTASTGPDAIFGAVVDAPATATRTLKVTWGGTKTTTVETLIMKYSRKAVRNEVTKFEVTLRPTGAVTEA